MVSVVYTRTIFRVNIKEQTKELLFIFNNVSKTLKIQFEGSRNSVYNIINRAEHFVDANWFLKRN